MADRFKDRVMAALEKPEDLPDELKAWLPRFLNDNINIAIPKTQITNLLGEDWSNIGATGKPALQNSWASYGAPYPTSRYRKNYLDEVFFEVAVKNGTITDGTPVVSLPAGYRPSSTLWFLGEGGGGVVVRMELDASGNLIIARHGTATNAYLLVSGVFRKYA